MESSINPLEKEGFGVFGVYVNSSLVVDKEGLATTISQIPCNTFFVVVIVGDLSRWYVFQKAPMLKGLCVAWDSYGDNEL